MTRCCLRGRTHGILASVDTGSDGETGVFYQGMGPLCGCCETIGALHVDVDKRTIV